MHCRKARLSLENNEPLDDESNQHVMTCRSCAELSGAQKRLDSAFEAARNERLPDSTPLSIVRARMAMRQNQKEISIMAVMKEILSAHRRLTLGIGLGVIALILFVAVPFPYQRTVGYSVSVAGLPAEIPGEALQKGLDAVGQEKAEVEVAASNGGFTYLISNLPNRAAARAVVAAIAALSGIESEAQINPIIETISASLYAQARERIIKIEVDGKGKTDDQIRAEIESKLAAQGLSPAFIFVKTDSSGERQIRLEINEKGNSSASLQSTIEVDSRGKTDEQIKAEVKARLAEQGHPDANITIERSGADSLRQIRIEIEDTAGH